MLGRRAFTLIEVLPTHAALRKHGKVNTTRALVRQVAAAIANYPVQSARLFIF